MNLILFHKKVWWILTPKLKSPQPNGHSVLHIPTKKSHTRKLVSKAHFLTFVRSVQQGEKNRKIKNFVPYWSVCCLLCMINCFLLLYPNAIKDQLKFEAALRVILLSLMNHFPGGTSEWGQLFYGVEFEFFNCLGFHDNLLESK